MMPLSQRDMDRLVKRVQVGAEDAGRHFLNGLKADARDALVNEVQRRLGGEPARAIPPTIDVTPRAQPERTDDRRVENPTFDHGDDADAEDAVLPMVFEGPDEEANLSRAACAWRLFHHRGDDAAVFQKGHIAFCGSADEYDEWCDARDIDSEDSDEYISENATDAGLEDHIEDIDFDPNDMDVVQSMAFSSRSANADFEAVHWGDKPDALGLHELDLSGPFSEFCIVEKIWYRAKKGGKLQWFVHTFSEESGEPVWGLVSASKKALVIHGGNFHVDEAGLID